MVLLVLIGLAALAGLLTALAARRWPAVDPSRAVEVAAREASAQTRRVRAFLRARIDPTAATGLGLTIALAGIVVGGILLGVLAVLVRNSDSGVVGLDRSIAVWGAEHATPVTTWALRAVTQLGATLTIVVLGLVLVVVESRRIPSRTMPLFLVIVGAGQLVIVNLIKAGVARVRPDIDPLAHFTGASFPSGHSTAAAACFAAAALVLSRDRSPRVRATLAGIAVGIAVAVASSRVLLGVHWLSDVLAGLALGWSWFALCSIAFGGRLLRFGAPVRAARTAAGTVDDLPSVSASTSRGYPGGSGTTTGDERGRELHDDLQT